jgi:GT2 family glycosyltransferase
MGSKKIGIVILNYRNWEDTVECVDSIFDQNYDDLEIVIVDNHSKNGSVEELSKRYHMKPQVHLLETKENVGFARGNNTGINYCKQVLKLNNVFACNNDVLFPNNEFFARLSQLEIPKDVGAIGTKIIGADGKNQNPVRIKYSFYALSKHLIEPILREIGLKKLLDMGHRFVQFLKKNKKSYSNKSESINVSTEKSSSLVVDDEYFLHGAAVYFTENYLKDLDGFYPETFLYYEENILGIIFEKFGLKMKYINELEMYHKEDQSMALSFDDVSSAKKKLLRKSILIAMKVRLASISKITRSFRKQPYPYELVTSRSEKN